MSNFPILNQSYGNWGLLSNIQIITHFPSRKVLHFYLVIMTTTMGWGVILIFCSCNKLNCSKKEIFSCDYTMAGVQTEKLALQTQHHRHLHKTLPSLTCTFCTQSSCILISETTCYGCMMGHGVTLIYQLGNSSVFCNRHSKMCYS